MGISVFFNNALKIAQPMPVTHFLYVTASYILKLRLTKRNVVKLTNELVFCIVIIVKFTNYL
ncbi:hypothetical protein CXF71_15825 [Colwellia sp. 12G3]|nr:hypothetical protein CXF71_15825 [Colwellia sp. 12G3]